MDVSSLYGHTRHQSFVLGESNRRVLLLHGFPGTPAEVIPLAEFLLTLGFEVHAPLHPGFGMGIENLGRTRWQDWVAAAQTSWSQMQKGAKSAVLIGFSMGGAVALNLAATAKPEQLVLIAPFWRIADTRALLLPVARFVLPQLKPFQNADFTTDVVRAQFERLEPTLNLDDPEVQRTLKERVALPTSALVELQRLGGNAYRIAPSVSVPTLVVQGRRDTTVSPADTRRLALRLGGPVSLTELEEAGHPVIEPKGAGHGALLERLRQNLS